MSINIPRGRYLLAGFVELAIVLHAFDVTDCFAIQDKGPIDIRWPRWKSTCMNGRENEAAEKGLQESRQVSTSEHSASTLLSKLFAALRAVNC
jgi:hypothetical protein